MTENIQVVFVDTDTVQIVVPDTQQTLSIKVAAFFCMQNANESHSTAKYAQRCERGVQTGIVGVYIGHDHKFGLKLCGNGRIHRLSKQGARELEIRGKYATEPEYCKYHKLNVTDTPRTPPATITLEFEFYVHSDMLCYSEFLNRTQDHSEKDLEMVNEKKYYKVPYELTLHRKGEVDPNCHEYIIQDSEDIRNAYSKEGSSDEAVRKAVFDATIRVIGAMNRYVLEFQILPAHPDVPGLYFGASVGYPADQLAVLLGGKLYAQHKFDKTERHNKKIIHVALESVLARFERVCDMMEMQTDNNESKDAQQKNIRDFCQRLLDRMTEKYMHGVLHSMRILKNPLAILWDPKRNDEYWKMDEDARISTADMREVCEYQWFNDCDYLRDSEWKFNVREFMTNPNLVTVTPLRVSMPSELKMQSIAYKVVTSIIEPEGGTVDVASKFNVFSAFHVFLAYIQIAYLRHGRRMPIQLEEVLGDAQRLQESIKSLKKSSNFALKCLTLSCNNAWSTLKDATFYNIAEVMIRLSARFIPFILQRNTTMSHKTFEEFMNDILDNLRYVHKWTSSVEKMPNSTSVEDMRGFMFNDQGLDIDREVTFGQFFAVLFGTQLNILARMRVAETEKDFKDFYDRREKEVRAGQFKNYFRLISAQRLETPPPSVPSVPKPSERGSYAHVVTTGKGPTMPTYRSGAENTPQTTAPEHSGWVKNPPRATTPPPPPLETHRRGDTTQTGSANDGHSSTQTTEPAVPDAETKTRESRSWRDAATRGKNQNPPEATATATAKHANPPKVIARVRVPSTSYRDAKSGHGSTQTTEPAGPDAETKTENAAPRRTVHWNNDGAATTTPMVPPMWADIVRTNTPEITRGILKPPRATHTESRAPRRAEHDRARRENRPSPRVVYPDNQRYHESDAYRDNRRYHESDAYPDNKRYHESDADGQPTGGGTPLHGLTVEKCRQIAEILYPTSMYYSMFLKFERREVGPDTIRDVAFFYVHDAIGRLRIRTSQDANDIHIRRQFCSDYVSFMNIGHSESQKRAPPEFVEYYLKNVLYIVLSTLNENKETMQENGMKSWFEWIKNAVHWMKPHLQKTFGFDVNCDLQCFFDGFKNIEGKTWERCEDMLFDLYRALKCKACTDRELYSEPEDDTIVETFRENSRGGKMSREQFISAMRKMGFVVDWKSDSLTRKVFDRLSGKHGAVGSARGLSETMERGEPATRRSNARASEETTKAATDRNRTEGNPARNTTNEPPPGDAVVTAVGRTGRGNAIHVTPDRSSTRADHVQVKNSESSTGATSDEGRVGRSDERDTQTDRVRTSSLSPDMELGETVIETTYGNVESEEEDGEDGDFGIEDGDVQMQDQDVERGDRGIETMYGKVEIDLDESPDIFIDLESFRCLFLGRLPATFYIEFVKTLHAHVQVLGNLCQAGGKWGGVDMVRSKDRVHTSDQNVFAIDNLTEIEKTQDWTNDDYAIEYSRHFITTAYDEWCKFENIEENIGYASCIMNVRSMMFDNMHVETMDEKKLDSIRRTFLKMGDLSHVNGNEILKEIEYGIGIEKYQYQYTLNNVGAYPYNDATVSFNRETKKYTYEDNKQPSICIGHAFNSDGKWEPKWIELPMNIPKKMIEEIEEITKLRLDKIKGEGHKGEVTNTVTIHLNIYERELIQIKLHDGTSVNVPLDPKLVISPYFYNTITTETRTQKKTHYNDKVKFEKDHKRKKYIWNFNTRRWDFKRETWLPRRIAKVIQSAGVLRDALNSNDIFPAAQSLWDICTQVRSTTNTEIQETLKKWCVSHNVSRGQNNAESQLCTPETFQQLRNVADDRSRKIEIEFDKVDQLYEFEQKMDSILRFRYVCLVRIFYAVLKCMKTRTIPLNTYTDIKTSIDNICFPNIGELVTAKEAGKFNLTLVLYLPFEGHDFKQENQKILVNLLRKIAHAKDDDKVTINRFERTFGPGIFETYGRVWVNVFVDILIHGITNAQKAVENLTQENIVKEIVANYQDTKFKHESNKEQKEKWIANLGDSELTTKPISPNINGNVDELKSRHENFNLYETLDNLTKKCFDKDSRELGLKSAYTEILRKIEYKTIKSNYENRRRWALRAKHTDDPYNRLQLPVYRISIIDSDRDRMVQSQINMANFFIYDCADMTNAISAELLTDWNGTFDAFRVANVLKNFEMSNGGVPNNSRTWTALSEKIKGVYKDNKTESSLRASDTNKHELFDFLQRQWTLYYNDMIILNLDNDTIDVKFNQWHNHVINFLTRLIDKSTEVQLNAVYLQIDRIEIRKIIRELRKLKEDNMHKLPLINPIPSTFKAFFGMNSTSKRADILKRQDCKIIISLPVSEMIYYKTFHVKDNDHIKKCVARPLNDKEVEISCEHGYHVDLWLDLILTTMHVQLSFFQYYYSDKPAKFTFAPPEYIQLTEYFATVMQDSYQKWDYIRSRPPQKTIPISLFSEINMQKILHIASRYQDFMNSSKSKNGTSTLNITGDTNIYRAIFKIGSENGVIFKRDLQSILSRIMNEQVYPICERDQTLKKMIRTILNAAINNDTATLLMSHNDLSQYDKNDTPENRGFKVQRTKRSKKKEKDDSENLDSLKRHVNYIIEICEEWYKLPYFKEISHESFLDLEFMYMSEESRGSLHYNIIS